MNGWFKGAMFAIAIIERSRVELIRGHSNGRTADVVRAEEERVGSQSVVKCTSLGAQER